MSGKWPIVAAGLLWIGACASAAAADTAVQPMSASDCAALASALSKAIGIKLTTHEGPAPSYPDGLRGKACLISGKATGLTLDFDRARDKIEAQLAGWKHLTDLDADGPYSTAKVYARGSGRLAYQMSTEPPRGTCKDDKPIGDCKVAHRR